MFTAPAAHAAYLTAQSCDRSALIGRLRTGLFFFCFKFVGTHISILSSGLSHHKSVERYLYRLFCGRMVGVGVVENDSESQKTTCCLQFSKQVSVRLSAQRFLCDYLVIVLIPTGP
jgi:hypothetical protein